MDEARTSLKLGAEDSCATHAGAVSRCANSRTVLSFGLIVRIVGRIGILRAEAQLLQILRVPGARVGGNGEGYQIRYQDLEHLGFREIQFDDPVEMIDQTEQGSNDESRSDGCFNDLRVFAMMQQRRWGEFYGCLLRRAN